MAKRFNVSPPTVRHWLARARGQRLDRVDWSDRRGTAERRPGNRTAQNVEDRILVVRRELKEKSALGEFGAEAIHRELARRHSAVLPSVRTIGRILERRGALDGRQRVRRAPPPPGWYLSEVLSRRYELDSFDIVEGLVIEGSLDVEVLNVISLHGGLVGSWPKSAITAKIAADLIPRHWRDVGLPGFAQFDNDTIFQGPHQHPDTVGRVTRICLTLGVVPVFAPPRETGLQAAIESFNGRWQKSVWGRTHFKSRQHLKAKSDRYIRASRRRSAVRIESAPARKPFPSSFTPDLQAHPQGRIVYVRRTDDKGRASLLGRTFAVARTWPHRLVRADVLLNEGVIRFHALRRRDPTHQPLLQETEYELPKRHFGD